MLIWYIRIYECVFPKARNIEKYRTVILYYTNSNTPRYLTIQISYLSLKYFFPIMLIIILTETFLVIYYIALDIFSPSLKSTLPMSLSSLSISKYMLRNCCKLLQIQLFPWF
jgi:hypothetical protein